MALARWAQGLPARILCVALEVTSTLLRAELDQLTPTGEVGIGVCLFGDGAGAAVVSNCIVQKPGGRTHGLFDIVEWRHELVPDSTDALTYHVNAKGWRAVLTPEIPKFVIRHVKGVFDALMDEGSSTDDKVIHHTPDAHSFDWALHPGGRAIIDGVEEALGLHPDRLRASRHIYKNFGNASSATNLTVLDKLREIHEGGRDVIALAFGPGIVVEMLLLHRP